MQEDEAPSSSSTGDYSIEDDEALEVNPLRTLTPVFQSPMGFGSFTPPNPQPVMYVSPYGPSSFSSPFPVAFPPPFATTPPYNGAIRSTRVAPRRSSRAHGRRRRRSFHAPPEVFEPANGDVVTTSYGRKVRKPTLLGGYSYRSSEVDDGDEKKPAKIRYARPERIPGLDVSFLSSPNDDPREPVETVKMAFEALRRRISQLDEGAYATKRPDLKASAILLTNGFRANIGKRIGHVPGVEIGDIFYFRMELCLVGLHAPSMGGIDFMSSQDDTVAVSIVSSGGYENEEDDDDVLVYTGSGGSGNHVRKIMDDQKLVRGNLALERSLLRDNLIRVIRSTSDVNVVNGKIYIYDGLYRVHESWDERGSLGYKLFKFKLLREPGQPDGLATWKKIQKWKQDPSSRGGVVISDISSGVENLPVCLVNDVDGEKGHSFFQYVTSVTYRRPLASMRPLQGCTCLSVCLPSDTSCDCVLQNGGNLPYSSSGLLATRKPMIYECNDSCHCSESCRNRVSQRGVRLRFEVFRTKGRGWGLRSWDPIRAGSFICEYTGELIDDIGIDDDIEDGDYIFRTNPVGKKTWKWNYGPELLGEPSTYCADEDFKSLPIIISAKKMGNVSRFMNHSCSPNVFWQPVQHDHSVEGRPHIMFFALLHIPPMTELTYDYGDGDPKFGRSKKCHCGSVKCRGVFG